MPDVYPIEIGDGRVVLVDEENHIITCSWFAKCKRPAAAIRQHSVLGGVPICARCDAKIEELST